MSGNNVAKETEGKSTGKQVAEMTVGAMILYSVPNIGSMILDTVFEQFGAVLYVDHKLITVPILYGIAVMIARVFFDAFANPVVGYLSDTGYGKRGRRIPFVLKGTLPMVLFFILFFIPVSKTAFFQNIFGNETKTVAASHENYSVNDEEGTLAIDYSFDVRVGGSETPAVAGAEGVATEPEGGHEQDSVKQKKFSELSPAEKKKNVFNFIYATITLCMFLFLFTYVVAPYLALLPDLARRSDTRVKLSTFQAITGIIGTAIAFVACGAVVQQFLDKGYSSFSYTWMAVIFGILSLITFYLMAFTIKEKPIAKEDRVKLKFWECVIPALKSKAFLIYIFSISSFWVGFKVLQTSVIFVCKHMFGMSETFGSVTGMGGMMLVWLISTPFVFMVQKKFGKRAVFGFSLLIIAILSSLQGLIGLIPHEFGLIYYLVLLFIFGMPFAALLVLYNAVLGDIIDLDEKQTGYRREAMYYGMEGLFTKTARGLGAFMVMLLFQLFGTPSPANHMALVISGPVCGIFAFLGFVLFLRYPIKD
ncbi:MAG TPA: MFS transporter [bacterium]|nr:MFS transporter [bacterium]